MTGLVSKGNNQQQKRKMNEGLKAVTRHYEVERDETKCSSCDFYASYKVINCPICGQKCWN